LREALVPLVAEIAAALRCPNETLLSRCCLVPAQIAFGREVAAAIGFDFAAGRLDVTAHPFCTTLGPYDTRLTTRYDENFFPSALFGTMHEAGHGMYEQGLPADQFGLPAGEAVSLGIHESQSRLWENLVGRSRAFWQHFFPKFRQTFSDAYGDVKLDEFYGAINAVRPSLIRVEADEATYNLHILIRFELEQALLSGELPVRELPRAWQEKYQTYMGIAPPDDADGCLQDVHWSAGLLGYFPTYTLGNLYASQFFEAAARQLGDLHAQFAKGEFLPLRNWLGEQIHSAGQCYTANELVSRVTGEPLSHEPFMRHLREKLAPLYGL
jgi:carboxypeptidase Taq